MDSKKRQKLLKQRSERDRRRQSFVQHPPLPLSPGMPSSGFGLPDLDEESGNSARSAPPRASDVHGLWWDQYKVADGLEWHSLYSVGVYANDARWDQLERVVELLANRLTELTPPLPAILSQLRLCNRIAAAERLLDAVKPFVANPDLMPHARNQYIEWLLFGAYQRCLDRGASDDEIEANYRFLLGLGAKESEELQRGQRDFIRRLAGQEPPWTREELKPGDEVGRRVYLLLVDFQRWLQRERGCEPMVADELRRLMVHAIDGTKDLLPSFLKGLRRGPFETFLAQNCLGFMSLTRFHAPAIVCAMYHFYEFLGVSVLVEPQVRDMSQRVCRDLWAELRKAAKAEWQEYRFLAKCFPENRGSFFPAAREQPGQESPD